MKSPIKQGCYLSPWLSLVPVDITDYNYRNQLNSRLPILTAHFPSVSKGKESGCNAGDMGLILGSGRSPEKGMATYPSILTWRIPWTKDPSGLYSPWDPEELDMSD